MKRMLCLIAAMLFSLMSCVAEPYPRDGIWYCDDLELYLDMSNSTGCYLDDVSNEYEPLFIQIDYGTGFYIYYCESESNESYLNGAKELRTDYLYNGKVLLLKDRESKQNYEFVEVEEGCYPGGS